MLKTIWLVCSLTIAVGVCNAQASKDFAGEWVVKLGNSDFLVLKLAPTAGRAGLTGSLTRPQHFSTGDGRSFYGIKGPAVIFPVVRAVLKGNCASLTVQDPSDKHEDNFQLCSVRPGAATLELAPSLAPLPMSKTQAPAAVTSEWDGDRTYFLNDTDVSDPEMQRIFEADQKDREAGLKIDWKVVGKADAARRTATAKLLSNGKLHTGEDFGRAAFIFQHGDTPNDYLLAHALAMVSVARGQSGSSWIAAASLDRYLQSIGKPQIFGTQFLTKPGQPATQEPYDRSLIPDSLRKYLSVPLQSEQEQQRKIYDRER